MATILPFSDAGPFLDREKKSRKAFLDTNILFSYSYDTDIFHDEVLDIFSVIKEQDAKIYSNITTRSEFIELQRRIIITEALTWVANKTYGIKLESSIAKKLKSHTTKVRRRANEGNPWMLSDNDIKEFKKVLSISTEESNNVWLEVCSDNLGALLKKSFEVISRYIKLEYISLRADYQSPEVISEVSWEGMCKIIETTGLSTNDAMILNIFQNTDIPFLFTSDFDVVYASAILPTNKYVFCPKSMYDEYNEKYRHILKTTLWPPPNR